ncbi:hypothetical protein [Schumannella luteola]|jgi:hypothetical protein
MPRVRRVLTVFGLAGVLAAPLLFVSPAAAEDWVEPLWIYPVTNATTAAVTNSDGGALAEDEPRRGQTVLLDYELSTTELRAGTAALVLALPPGVTVDPAHSSTVIENISVSTGCAVGSGPFAPASSPVGTTQVMIGCTIPDDEPADDPSAHLRVALTFGAAASRETVIYAITSTAPTYGGLPLVLHGSSLGGEEAEPPSPPSPELAATGAAAPGPTLAAASFAVLVGAAVLSRRRLRVLGKLSEK